MVDRAIGISFRLFWVFVPLALLTLREKCGSQVHDARARACGIQLGWALVGYPAIDVRGAFKATGRRSISDSHSGVIFVCLQAALVVALWMLDGSALVKRWEVSCTRAQAISSDNWMPTSPHVRKALIQSIRGGNYFASQNHLIGDCGLSRRAKN